jgi:hypothetical protein
MPPITVIKALVKEITGASSRLPSSIQQGSKTDKIWSVLNADAGETAHETFNKRFDALFAEDCRDSAGRLHYIRRGKLGMGLICSYLLEIDWDDGFPLDLVEIKLKRLAGELKVLW